MSHQDKSILIAILSTLVLLGAGAPPAFAQQTVPPPRQQLAPQLIHVPAQDGAGPALDLYVYRPAETRAPPPSIIALHGCGGLLTRSGSVAARERAFAAEFTALGYAVLMPDSFNPRGLRELCTIALAKRPIAIADRRNDVLRLIRWLAGNAVGLDGRYALVGWSNGGSTLLATLDAPRWPTDLPTPVASFAFYPGCTGDIARIAATIGTLTMYLAGDDNWARPQPCQKLAQRLRDAPSRVELHVYEGAVHGFDSPSSRPRVRSDVPLTRNGEPVQVRVGSHPAARAQAYGDLRTTLARRLPALHTIATPAAGG